MALDVSPRVPHDVEAYPVPSKRSLFRKKYKKNNGKLPGPPKGGRPPGVPWSAAKKNPSPPHDLLYEVIPGAGGFAVTKVVGRIAYGVAYKKNSKWAKHIGVLASVGTFGLLWAAAHKIKQIAAYHTPIVVGSAIAALQTVLQSYVPQYGWLIGTPSELENGTPGQQAVAGGDGLDYDNLLEGTGDDDMTYDESMEAQAQAQQQQRRRPRQAQKSPAQAAAQSSNDSLDDLLNDLDDGEGGGAGIFSN